MKTLLVSGAVAVLSLGFAAADDHMLSEAGKEFKMACEAYQKEHNGNTDCMCLAKKMDKDEALAAALAKITSPADVEMADEKTLEAIAACQKKEEM